MKIALVGTGQIAQRHLKAFQQIENVQIAGHVGTDQAKADAAAAAWGGRGYTRIEALIAAEKPDAVWITTPPDQHGPLETALLNAGIPFLVEKPLSADRETAEAIGEAIARRNALVAVGYNWRANDKVVAVRTELARSPARMVIGTFHVNTPHAEWWIRQARSGGQMVEQATHLIDLARALLGEGTLLYARAAYLDRPTYPNGDIAGVSAAIIGFEGGVIGSFTATCILAKGASAQLQLMCENLLITVRRDDVSYDDGKTTRVETTAMDTYEAQNRAFLNAVRTNDHSLIFSDYADALRTHRLCHDILEQGSSDDV